MSQRFAIRFLVVDDEESIRRLCVTVAEGMGFTCMEAANGEEALAAVKRQRPDLILVDIQIPILIGYEATRRIKADPTLRAIPIIAITSYALSGDEQKA